MAGQQTTGKPRRHTDAELLRQLEADPDGGMGAIMAQFTAPLWHAARSHLENPEDIKECINDTFLDFYIHRAQFDPEKGALSTYLSRIVRNKAIDRYRRNQAHGSAPLPEDLQDPTSPTEQVELRQDLEQALNRLSPEDAELVRMRYFMEMTVQEIADRLGLPYETVKKRSQRSLSRLKKILLGLLLVGALAVLAACAGSGSSPATAQSSRRRPTPSSWRNPGFWRTKTAPSSFWTPCSSMTSCIFSSTSTQARLFRTPPPRTCGWETPPSPSA